MIYILISIISIYCLVSFGQSFNLNQLNASGKRQGKWLIYIDKDWKEVKDTNLHTYKFYDEYLNGKSLTGIGTRKFKYKHELAPDNKSHLLNGEYKWLKKNGVITEKHLFRNGEIVNSQLYGKNGEVEFYIDYTISYDNNPFSYGMYYYYEKRTKSVFHI